MLHATHRMLAGQWPAEREVGTVTLDWDARHRRRFRLDTDQGEELLLDLPATLRLGQDDGLVVGDSGIVRIIAAEEDLLEIRAGEAGLARLAYHLGNRHLLVEICPDCLIIRADAVIEDMILVLGGEVQPLRRPFSPESGAYGGGHRHE
jgi:urease accessory protein